MLLNVAMQTLQVKMMTAAGRKVNFSQLKHYIFSLILTVNSGFVVVLQSTSDESFVAIRALVRFDSCVCKKLKKTI